MKIGRVLNLQAFAIMCLVVALASPPDANCDEARTTTFSYHDGVPNQYAATDGRLYALGTFFYPTDSGRYYLASKFRFYHGYDYPPPQVGYEYRLYLVYRDLSDNDYFTVHINPQTHLPPLTTTCNYCWEEIDIPYWAMPIMIGGDTFDRCLGLFIRPESDSWPPSLDYPFPWIDSATDYPMTTSEIIFYLDSEEAYEAVYSDMGELLIDIEIIYLDEIAVEETTFSKLKQIWSPPLR